MEVLSGLAYFSSLSERSWSIRALRELLQRDGCRTASQQKFCSNYDQATQPFGLVGDFCDYSSLTHTFEFVDVDAPEPGALCPTGELVALLHEQLQNSGVDSASAPADEPVLELRVILKKHHGKD